MSVPGNVVYSISTYLEDNVHEILERVSLTICKEASIESNHLYTISKLNFIVFISNCHDINLEALPACVGPCILG